jgi:membrane associated rhomboid family serine protease
MIPIRDDVPHTTTPWVNYFLIALNTVVFLFEVALAPTARNEFIYQFGVVPSHTTALLAGVRVTPELALLPLFTSMFLHASWLHLLANMWALWIFGDNVEDHLGHGRYLLMYLLAGLAGSVAHIAFNPLSQVPSVGASGAIAGVMGAYFVLYPRARVLTLVPFFFVFFLWLPAWIVLGYWFVVQFLGGASTAIAYSKDSGGGIAFWAHVGGFCAGLAMIKLFRSRPRRYQYMTWGS